MKNIFKKNQIIITALAIMIAIAGYLSFTNNDKPEEPGTVETANPDLEEYEVISEADTTGEVAEDTTGEDTLAEDTESGEVVVEDAAEDTAAEDADSEDAAAEDGTEVAVSTENDETTPVKSAADTTDEDISDEDILDSASNVTDTGELENSSDVPGEAVLASTSLDRTFFTSQRLEREQDRSKSNADLKAIIDSPDVTADQKQAAIDRMLELTEIVEKENGTELMLKAKGFDDAIVSIDEDGAVDVVINAPTISDQQLAIIEDVVKKKTDASVKDITINPVIVEE